MSVLMEEIDRWCGVKAYGRDGGGPSGKSQDSLKFCRALIFGNRNKWFNCVLSFITAMYMNGVSPLCNHLVNHICKYMQYPKRQKQTHAKTPWNVFICTKNLFTLCILQIVSPEGYHNLLCYSLVASLRRQTDVEQIVHCFSSEWVWLTAKQRTEAFWMVLDFLQNS